MEKISWNKKVKIIRSIIYILSFLILQFIMLNQISRVTGPEKPKGFQEVKVPRFRVNGTGLW